MDVLMIPSRKVAIESIELFEYWIGEGPVVFENVPVTLPAVENGDKK